MRTKKIVIFDLIPGSFGKVSDEFDVLSIDPQKRLVQIRLRVSNEEMAIPLPQNNQAFVVPLKNGAGVMVLEGENLALKADDIATRSPEAITHKQVKDTTAYIRSMERYISFIVEYGLDFLTGLPGLKPFSKTLEQLFIRPYLCSRMSNFSALILDVNRFKRINDIFGHQVGNQVLKRFADAVSSAVREEINRGQDFVFRYAGDEFAVILKNCNAETAIRVAGRIRRALKTIVISAPNKQGDTEEIFVSCSIGIADATTVFNTNLADISSRWKERNGSNPQLAYLSPDGAWMVEAADRAMYYVKGRETKDAVGVACGLHEDGKRVEYKDVTADADASITRTS